MPLAGADPVVWYCFGVTHVVRVEDFPIMPCEVTGFHIKPFGFFSGECLRRAVVGVVRGVPLRKGLMGDSGGGYAACV